MTLSNYLIRFGQAESSILQELHRQQAAERRQFWTIFFVVVGVIFLTVLSVWLYCFFVKRLDKRFSESIKIPGHDERVHPSLICTVHLYGSDSVLLKKGDAFVAPLIEKNGYDFCGWFYDTAFTEPYKTRCINKDITLYPKWVRHD